MAAAAPARDAFAGLDEFTGGLATEEIRNREPRYLFYAGDEPMMPPPGGLAVSSPVIPDKNFWRCQVTPALSVPVRLRKVDIPEGRLLAGTEDGRGLASMLLPCGPEVDELLAQYGHADRAQWQKRWGLVELTALRGKQPREVAALNLTTTFFPDWPHVPETNREVEAALKATLTEIEASPQTEATRLLAEVGGQMLDAARQAQEYQQRLIQQGNIRVTYPDTNDGFKPGFDAKDELFATRSGIGLAVNALRGNQSDALAAGMGGVLEKVLAKFQPQTAPALDPNQVAAIVAATVQALQQADRPAAIPAATPAEPKVKKLA